MEGIATPWPDGSREENIPRVQREPGPGVGGEPVGGLATEKCGFYQNLNQVTFLSFCSVKAIREQEGVRDGKCSP